MTAKKTIGIVGARGHTGTELIRLVANHPGLELAFVSSRELDGQRVAEHNDAYRGELRYASLDPTAVAAAGADVVVLALPNGKAAPFVAAVDAGCRGSGGGRHVDGRFVLFLFRKIAREHESRSRREDLS